MLFVGGHDFRLPQVEGEEMTVTIPQAPVEPDVHAASKSLARRGNPASGQITRSLLAALELGSSAASAPETRIPITLRRWRQKLMAIAS